MPELTKDQTTRVNDFIVSNYADIPNKYAVLRKSVNKEFGTNFSEEAIRRRVRTARKHGRIQSVVHPVGSEVGNVLVQPTYQEKIDAQRVKLLMQQQDQQERAEIREDAKFQNLLATIEGAVSPLKLEFTHLNTAGVYNTSSESACLVLSDLHFGKKTSGYNMEIALRRFVTLIDKTLDVLSEREKINPIKEIHLLWTGDIVDGEQIYKTHGSHLDTHVVNQIFKSIEIVAPQVARFVEAGYVVHNHFVRGNHGRISHFHNEVSNWDYIYGLTLQMALKDVPNLTFDVSDGWQQIVEVQGHRILQFHGHQIKMQLNLPWYSLTTRINRWATAKTIEDFDITVSGHFHNSSFITWNDKKVFTNGTMVVGDQFALEYLGLEASECQHFFGVAKDTGVTWHYELGFNDKGS